MRFFPFFSRYFSVKLSLIMKIVFLFHFLSFYSNELCDVPLHYFTERCNNDEHWIKNLNLTQFKIYMFYIHFFYLSEVVYFASETLRVLVSLCLVRTNEDKWRNTKIDIFTFSSWKVHLFVLFYFVKTFLWKWDTFVPTKQRKGTFKGLNGINYSFSFDDDFCVF